MAKHNKAIALALVGVCGLGVWKLGGALLADEAAGAEHAVNQLWIDHVPRDDRDMIMHMVLLDHPQGRFGAFGQSSQWRHMIEIARWDLGGGKLRLFFPQERQRAELGVETWECEGEAPAPFELCMRLTNKQGRSFVLYSREDWKVQPRDAEASLAELIADEPALAGLRGTLATEGAEALSELDLDAAESWPLTDKPF